MGLLPSLALAVCVVEPSAAKPQGTGRPALSGETRAHLTADGHFKIHYTLEGADAIPGWAAVDEEPRNGVPDAVDWAEEGAARMVAVFVGEDGWPAPVSDEGNGGDDRTDLYLRLLPEGGNGQARGELTPSGNVAGYMIVTPVALAPGKVPFESVVGHEVFHILELAVGRSFIAGWIAEASATYAQYLLFTGDDRLLGLAREALWKARFVGAQRPIDDEDGTFEYAGMVWVKYLVDRGGGDRKLLLALWRAMAGERSWVRGHDAFLPRIGVASLDDAAAEHAVWNWFACGNDDGRHYARDATACTLALFVDALSAAPPPSSGESVEVGLRGSAFVTLEPDCASADLAVTVRPEGRMRFQLVAQAREGESQVTERLVEGGAEATLTVAGWGRHAKVALVGTSLAFEQTFTWEARVSGAHERPTPVALAVDSPALALAGGERRSLRATATYGTCDDGRDVTAEVAWSSTDPRVVTVAGGLVEAVGPGSAQVLATAGSVGSNRIDVTVAPDDDAGAGGCRVGRGAPGWLALAALLSLFVRIRSVEGHS
jgi:hypothetical protein